MKESLSAWQMVFKGIKWGCLIVVLNSLAAPCLYEMVGALGNLRDGIKVSLPIGFPEVWLLVAMVIGLVFAVPSVIGGVGLSLWLFFRARRGPLSPQASIPIGAIIGVVVGIVNGLGLHLLFLWTDTAERGQVDWIWLALVIFWSMLVYGWAGQRLAHGAAQPHPKVH
jgi:hypothetical protein